MKRKLKAKARSGSKVKWVTGMTEPNMWTKSVRSQRLPGHKSLGFGLSAWRGGSTNFLPKVRNTKDRPFRDHIYATGQGVWYATRVEKGSHARD